MQLKSSRLLFFGIASFLVIMTTGISLADSVNVYSNDGTLILSNANASSHIINKIYGIDFSPYMDGQNPEYGSVVDREQVKERMQIIELYTIWIRTYGTENGLEHVAPLAREMGLKTAIGAWLGTDSAANERQINELINEMKAGNVDLAIVGSETLYRNDLSEEQLINYIKRVKEAAPGINVTTADIYGEILSHPNVVKECDVIMYNVYPYWEGISIENAITVLDSRHKNIVSIAGGKTVIISETGWPSGGNTIGSAVPSPENSARYFNEFVSWARENNIQYFFFEAFDETWKTIREGPQGAHWGVWDKDGNMKPGMETVFYVIPIDVSPELAAIGDKSVTENTLLEFIISAIDVNGDSISFSATDVPAGATFNATTCTFSWKPVSGTAGVYNVTFIATANGLNDSETISITVSDWNPWNDSGSNSGESISLSELQEAIYDWRFGIVLPNGETVDLSRLQGLIYSWRFG